MKFKYLIVSVISAVVMSGCASTPPLAFSVPDVTAAQKKIDAELKSLTVTVARNDEKTGSLPSDLALAIPSLWQTALVESLNRMAIFQDDSPNKVSIAIKILKFELPDSGFELTTVITARYEILDRKTGKSIFAQELTSSGTTELSFAFNFETRKRESINRAVQNNISQFLHAVAVLAK